MNSGRILLVESEPFLRTATQLLTQNFYQTTVVNSATEACQFDLNSFHLIICNHYSADTADNNLLGKSSHTPILILSQDTSVANVVDAIKRGAEDYVAVPFNDTKLLQTIETLIKPQLSTEKTTTHKIVRPEGIIGESAPMLTLFKRINRVAPTEATVMILGESGTGKELVARALHDASKRQQQPMISVNCAAIPETLIESELFGHEKGAFTSANAARKGLVEAADGGTLFLDEIGELPLEAQARLLRVLQEGEIRRVGSVESHKVDVRLIVATHRDLRQMAQNGQFREDLYYRLNVLELNLPPLRERSHDVILLAKAILEKMMVRSGTENMLFSPQALLAISQHNWPGNVRELENAIERAVILSEDNMVTPELLGLKNTTSATQPLRAVLNTAQNPLAQQEANELSMQDYFLRFVLDHQNQMNETQLAQKLGISRKCLWERRKRLGIPRKEVLK